LQISRCATLIHLNSPIPKRRHAVEAIEDFLIVRDHKDCRLLLPRRLVQQVYHHARALGVECRCSLVRQNDLRHIDQSPSYRNALCLAAEKP